MSKVTRVIGAVAVGFLAGILLAPKSGKDTRQEIRARLTGTKARLAEESDRVREAVNDNKQTVQTGASEISQEVTGFAGKAKLSAQRVGDEAKGLGKEAKGSAKRISKTAKKTATAVGRDVKKRIR